MKVAIYARVSTTNQAQEGYSIDGQLSALSSYCDAKGWQVADTYTDAGYTGSNLDRPALQRLLLDINRKKVDAVLIYKLDRLSRNVRDTLYLAKDIFEANGISFISLSENIDTSTAMGALFLTLLSAIAEFEREQITERMQMGKVGRAKSGKAMSWIYPPFGYDYVDGEYIVNEFESQLVREMFDYYLKTSSVTALVVKLNDDGHIGKDIEWTYRTVKQTLTNPVHIGKNQFKGNVYDGDHEAIVSEEIFNLAQSMMDKNRREAYNQRPFESKYLLSGIIRCGECGAPMMSMLGSIRIDGTRKRYYRCKSFKKYSGAGKNYSHIKCTSKSVDMYTLEDKVREQIDNIWLNPTDLPKAENSLSDKKAVFENELERLENQLEKLLELFIEDVFSQEVMEKKRLEINTKIDAVNEKIYKLEIDCRDAAKKEALDTLSGMSKSIFDLDPKSQKRIVNQLIESIHVTKEILTIKWVFD